MKMTQFYLDHGADVVDQILKDVPEGATNFVYAYVAKSIDYLAVSGRDFQVFHHGAWKPVVDFVADSFRDIAYSIEELKQVAESHAVIALYGDIEQAKSRRAYFDWMPSESERFMQLDRAIKCLEA
ncbi:hypothetical protein WCE14_09115 [Acinetobacter schindleri]|uniref:hypothetical protein n=1 Tax=Acinetobacter schindleri TaxID=108981 RepID=UPI0034D7A8A9